MPSRWYGKEGILPVALGLMALGVALYFLLFAPELRDLRAKRADRPEFRDEQEEVRRGAERR